MADQSEVPEVRMRNGRSPLVNANAQSALQRGLEALQEGEHSEETEEIRKLDSQLDHLNDYMSRMEQKLKDHNERMMETIRQQKEDRERRRKSFHERMTQSQAEDNDFQAQMRSMLTKVENHRNRQSVYDIIKDLEVPKVNE